MLIEIFSIIAPVFICAVIGFSWMKMGLGFDTTFVSKIVTYVGAPCLIFSTFLDIELDLESFSNMVLASLMATLCFGVMGFIALKSLNLSMRAFLPSQMLPNNGNMGLPLCLLAFGDEGLAFGLTYFTVSIVIGLTFGISISSGKMTLREFLKNPMFLAIVFTMIIYFTGLQTPDWLNNTTELLAGLTIPLMLIALGVSLAQFRITSLGKSLGLALLRIVGGFLVGLGIAELLSLEGAARGIMIMQSSMPIAVFAYLFAIRYDRQPEEVAGTVVISTLISFASLPLLLWFVLP